MCGISGLVWRSEPGRRRDAGQRAVRRMMAAIVHRGPDAQGIIVRDRVVLGHVRLTIIDRDGGSQPMLEPDGKIALSYNGEIYNFPKLIESATRRGYAFNSRSDTEAVLATYQQQGLAFDEQLNGMYAYALLDERVGGGRLLISTDPVGIKPLFLYEDDDVFLFASELRAIAVALLELGISPSVSERGVRSYLANGWVAAPETLLDGVRRLLPGERWIIDIDSGRASLHSCRLLPASTDTFDKPVSLDEQLRLTLADAVERQVISDVPLGFFLSGGVDSSLLLSLATSRGLATSTFTVRFSGSGHGVQASNEADVAARVAAILGSDHHELTIGEDTLTDSLDEVLSTMDQPIADPACLPLYHLSRFARQHVTVCISGDGGDELFAGYPRHEISRWQNHWRRVPSALRGGARSIVGLLPEAPSSGIMEKLRKARTGFRLLDAPGYMERLFPAAEADREANQLWHRPTIYHSDALMEADFAGQLAGQMLPKTDGMTMAHSLECRVPLLDLEVVELASAIPIHLKRQSGVGKLPLRRLLREYLPPSVTDSPKRGFRVPLTSWFRGDLAERIETNLLSSNARVHEFIDRDFTTDLVSRHISGAAEKSLQIWALLALETWLQNLSQVKLNATKSEPRIYTI